MGGGRPAPGPERGPDSRPLDADRPLAGYLDEIRAITRQGIVDVMLVSSSTPGAARAGDLRGHAGHPRHSRQRDHRHLGGAGRGLPERAVAPVPDRLARPGARPRVRSVPLLDHLQQPARGRRPEPRGVRGVPGGGRAVRHAPLPRGVQPERGDGLRVTRGDRRLCRGLHSPRPRGAHPGGAPPLPQDRLQRLARDDRAVLLRPRARRRDLGGGRPGPTATRSSSSPTRSATGPGWPCSAARSSSRNRPFR